jgi:hypothetical protein
MNNLTQTQQSAKQAHLDRQQEKMLAQYKKADRSERNAVIRQIDSFLKVVSKDERIFWLKFRRKLQKVNEKTAEIK